ncbi:serine/threonine protein kinase [Marinicella sp. S1101]|uniref:serine/threonine protein kinase n=1 Tax=Marinicella marina TaxID=2996016 RepID=UPI002260A7C4|nr:serine/threonine protein kinase [Marinicella marina]MCX7552913.1 serine/threonine protein kinase [Marinicella marina]MDJ1139778.1 serine/threonine protein kinase [Marinicella marina]
MSINPHPFDQLTPELILAAIESQQFAVDGSVTALNSYENRVYQIGMADDLPLIVKFYRPERWNTAQIQEEHDFCFVLKAHELPVVTPIRNDEGQSLFGYEGFEFALFKRTGGYAPELDHQDNLAIMGRTLARLHNIGATHKFIHRPILDSQNFGHDSINYVAESFIPFEFKTTYLNVCQTIMPMIEERLAGANNISVHGDLHVGNILLREDIPNLVDFDDSRLAPAIQDIWMLLSGDQDEQQAQLQKIIPAYEAFRPFPYTELKMIESLRTLRMIHHTAWLARRWDDPAFPPAFGWFDTHQYWQQHIADLQHQLQALSQNQL